MVANWIECPYFVIVVRDLEEVLKMASNIYDLAYELEQALKNGREYTTLQAKYEEISKDPAAKKLFDQFRNIQMKLQEKQMTGQNISQNEVQEAQSVAAMVQQNQKIVQLMDAEQQMSIAINEINKIIMKPLDELYGKMSQ